MHTAPTFDYYTELELKQSASSQEITSSFRRLAKIHHPDRNTDSQQEATARFQRIQLAYETLSDPSKRSRYDSTRRVAHTPSFDFPGDHNDDQGVWDGGFDYRNDTHQSYTTGSAPSSNYSSHYEQPWRHFEASKFYSEMFRKQTRWREEAEARNGYEYFHDTFQSPFTTGFNSRHENPRRHHEENEEEVRRPREQHTRTFGERIWRYEEAEEARLRTRQAAEMDAEIAKEQWENREREEEQQRQKQRWEQTSASTKEERQSDCRHPRFYRVIQHQKYFKCSACFSKCDSIASKCPLCSAWLCQLCVAQFSGRSFGASNGAAAARRPWFPTGGLHDPVTTTTPGATHGLIRNAMLAQAAPNALLRQAMERFGKVVSVNTINKHIGTAHVEFANHHGLCKALAASPVVVTDQVVLEVVELKD